MGNVEVVLALLTVTTVVAPLADRLRVPYPLLLVLCGLGLALLPGLPTVQLDPHLVFVLFLPPLVFFPAVATSLRDLRADARRIGRLAVVLVLFTVAVVGVLAHLLVPGLSWAAAFLLGAVVSPPDAVAGTSIARRMGLPRRIVTLLEGESLLNDATALVVYGVALTAVTTGRFSAISAVSRFAFDLVVGVAIGLVLGWLLVAVNVRLSLTPNVLNALYLLTPFAAYIGADSVGASGVIAVVSVGIFLGQAAPLRVGFAERLQGSAVSEVTGFLLTGLVFILIGLQLRTVTAGLRGLPVVRLVAYGALVSAGTILARLTWVYGATYVMPHVVPWRRRHQPVSFAEATVVGWTGMRGVVSLAAALAIPAAVGARNLIVFLTFCVILSTLLVQGLTLPALIRALGLPADRQDEDEEIVGRLAAADAALARLDELEGEEWVRPDTLRRARSLYGYRRNRFQARQDGDTALEEQSGDYRRLVRELIDAQRRAALLLRNSREINDSVMRRIERDLDLEEARLEPPG